MSVRKIVALAMVIAGVFAMGGVANAATGPSTKSIARSIKTIKKQIKSTRSTITKNQANLKKNQASVGASIAAVAQSVKDLDTKVGTISSAAVDALTKLQAGLVAVGDGLKSLQTLATSTEYGVAQVYIGANADPGAFVVTPDIPDAVQQAQSQQTFIAGSAGAVSVRVGVRTAETDTTAAAACRVTVTQGATFITSAPNAALGGAPFYNVPGTVQTSSAPADAGFPFGQNATVDGAMTDLTTGGNSVNSGAGVTIAAPGQQYTVSLACVDTTPSTTDPAA